MKWLAAIILGVSLAVIGLVVVVWVSAILAANRFDHFDDPVLRYLREHKQLDRKIPLVPDLFQEGEERATVVERLIKSGFETATTRCAFDAPDWEVWANPAKAYLFCVDLRFSEERLDAAVGRVIGPNLK